MRGLTSALAALVCVWLTPHAASARAVTSRAVTPHTASAHRVEIRDASLASSANAAALTLELDRATNYKLFTLDNPGRVVLDLSDSQFETGVRVRGPGGFVDRVRVGARPHGGLRIVLQLDSSATPRGRVRLPVHAQWHRGCGAASARTRGSACLVVKVGKGEASPEVARGADAIQAERTAQLAHAEGAPHIEHIEHVEQTAHTAHASPSIASVMSASAPTSRASASVTRANFTPGAREEILRPIPVPHAPVLTDRDVVIAVDAGHGGKDPGAIGRDGTEEKNVTLAIARALAARIDEEPGMRAVLTRDSDVFLLLKDRRDRAREARADLFVSVHADSIHDPTVSGASVYVLSERGATDEAANWLAERENAADRIGGVPLDDKNSTLKSVLIDLSQNESISASMTAAQGVIAALDRVGEVRKPQVQQAGFVVLKSRDIPSMLVETAYISNPGDERRLRSTRVQHKLADAIFKGLLGYFEQHPPVGTRFAQLHKDRSAGMLAGASDAPLEPATPATTVVPATTAAPAVRETSAAGPVSGELAARP